jgi:hypothetical protein
LFAEICGILALCFGVLWCSSSFCVTFSGFQYICSRHNCYVIKYSKFLIFVQTKKFVLSVISLIVLSHNQILIPHTVAALHIPPLHDSKATPITFSRKLMPFSSNTNLWNRTDCTDFTYCADCNDGADCTDCTDCADCTNGADCTDGADCFDCADCTEDPSVLILIPLSLSAHYVSSPYIQLSVSVVLPLFK